MSDLLRLQDVGKSAPAGTRAFDILHGVSLKIEPGEFVAIMGPSGSGKSTLMNLIGLLDWPSSGSLHFQGQDVTALSEAQAARVRCHAIGFIFQFFNLLPYLTVRENIALPIAYARRSVTPQGIDTLLESVGLQAHADSYPPTLSGGEKQRVAIARALANDPAMLLADEPTGALDSANAQQVMDLFTRLHRRGTTVVLITHDPLVAGFAQRRFLLRDGSLFQDTLAA